SAEHGSAPAGSEDELTPWRDPPPRFAQRNLGLAYARVGRQLELLPFILRGYQLLLAAWKDFPNDPVLLRAMGQIVSGTKAEKAEAVAEGLFGKALVFEPNSALIYD